MTWIFQGNPEKYDIDEYIARSPELVYWSVPKFKSEIAVGDRAYIWRSGDEAGAIASGKIVEAPVPADQVNHPDALGNDLWVHGEPDDQEHKVGIALDAVRLTPPEGMLSRRVIKVDSLLGASSLIRMPNATVFRFDDAQSQRMEQLWSHAQPEDEMLASLTMAVEGHVELVAHRRRERSRLLAATKREIMRAQTGSLSCEICGLSELTPYPRELAASLFEVHHRIPLAQAATKRRTTLDELALVCANCHRAIHATRDVDLNLSNLLNAFKRKQKR
jgi:hypothetical protein